MQACVDDVGDHWDELLAERFDGGIDNSRRGWGLVGRESEGGVVHFFLRDDEVFEWFVVSSVADVIRRAVGGGGKSTCWNRRDF